MAKSNIAVPGRTTTRTPTKPTMIAIQRRGPAHSPSSGPASAVTTIGADSKTDTVCASCNVSSALKFR